MKHILVVWNKRNTKCFEVINYRKPWKEIGEGPFFEFRTNGAKRKNGDKCLDVTLTIGYTVFNYVNFDLQNRR